jgi:hypothetical protein
MAKKSKANDVGGAVPVNGVENRTAPVVSSKVNAPGGVGAGRGLVGSGHAGHHREGRHPNAPKNG